MLVDFRRVDVGSPPAKRTERISIYPPENMDTWSRWIFPLKKSGWWFHFFLIFIAYLGKWCNLTNIFHMGWNHQPEKMIQHFSRGRKFVVISEREIFERSLVESPGWAPLAESTHYTPVSWGTRWGMWWHVWCHEGLGNQKKTGNCSFRWHFLAYFWPQPKGNFGSLVAEIVWERIELATSSCGGLQ